MNTRRIISKKSLGLFSLGLCLCLAAGFALLFKAGSGEVNSEAPFVLSLSGVPDGTHIGYRVNGPGTEPQIGQIQAGPDGQIKLPTTVAGNIKRPGTINYSLHIDPDKEQAPLSLDLKIDSETGRLALSGNGAGAFTEIIIEDTQDGIVRGRLETKTDWVGSFAGLYEPEDAFTSSGLREYRLALLGDAIQSDADGRKSPYIVQVQVYPGVNQDFRNNIVNNYVNGLRAMTTELSAAMMQQVSMIGMFMDAKLQMEAQADHQALQAEAVKDYHPDELMCRFGTFVRSVAQTEEKAKSEAVAINNMLMAAYTNQDNGITEQGPVTDIPSRLHQFRRVYCDPADNNGGLALMCDWEQDGKAQGGGMGADDRERMNKDIDFARTLGSKLTLDINYFDSTSTSTPTADEEDVIALARNLYWPDAFTIEQPDDVSRYFSGYMDKRQLTAIKNVAHTSFAEQAALKTRSVEDQGELGGAAFMKALMKEFGMNETEIDEMLGEYPSYYAQMEVLTKKIYQSPDFYTNLYTKPANIDRINTSIEAIKLMQLRDRYDVALRQEMLTSLMVEEALTGHQNRVNGRIESLVGK